MLNNYNRNTFDLDQMGKLENLMSEEKESAKAAYELGVSLSTGIYGEIDKEAAIDYLKKVSRLDPKGREREYVGKARRYLGYLYFENDDISNSMSYFESALQCGSLSAEEEDEIRAKIREGNKKLNMRKSRIPSSPSSEQVPTDSEISQPKTQRPTNPSNAKTRILTKKTSQNTSVVSHTEIKETAGTGAAIEPEAASVPKPRLQEKTKFSSLGKVVLVVTIILGIVFLIVHCSNAELESQPESYEDSEEYVVDWTDYPEDFIFPNSSSEYLNDWEVEELNLDDTQWAINEIYARHGVGFRDEPYKSYYDNCDWHESIYRVDDAESSWFNEYEQYNIDLLAEHRSALQ